MAAAIALTVILALLAVFQLALALGSPLGRFAWGGAHRVLPTGLRIGSLVSIVVYTVIAVLALDRVDVIDVVPDAVSAVGMWIVFGYFVLGIVMNAISRSKPERYTMTPVVAVLAVLSLLVALS
ncbi:hypothetical protein [Agromyces marinus]|uniref:Integral membrane protein n=1 Tax=Agromyces marinus TaxID=1389020 RepID=A0ABN6YAD3_9MICO|nr:hypothetical protein [Agromyces marinus]UIP57770.1 hypothetical protein DSM26151_06360 [Agromyces marinus]BDZ54054.1 hypothetical protein GCM10025870_11270 [Agromyces marinus]